MEVSEFRNMVWEYTRKIAEGLNCLFSPVGCKYGLTMMQLRILLELCQCGPHTIGSLADRTCIAGTNISALCKKLEAQGLVERVRNKEDERVVKVALTRTGQDIVLEIDRLCNDKFAEHLVNETEETFEDIISGLQKLNDLLERVSKFEKE